MKNVIHVTLFLLVSGCASIPEDSGECRTMYPDRIQWCVDKVLQREDARAKREAAEKAYEQCRWPEYIWISNGSRTNGRCVRNGVLRRPMGGGCCFENPEYLDQQQWDEF